MQKARWSRVCCITSISFPASEVLNVLELSTVWTKRPVAVSSWRRPTRLIERLRLNLPAAKWSRSISLWWRAHRGFAAGIMNVPIVRHPLNRKKMEVSLSGRGREAITEYRVLESGGGVSLIECRPRTGRTHQIRVHLKHLGLSGSRRPSLRAAGKLFAPHAARVEAGISPIQSPAGTSPLRRRPLRSFESLEPTSECLNSSRLRMSFFNLFATSLSRCCGFGPAFRHRS